MKKKDFILGKYCRSSSKKIADAKHLNVKNMLTEIIYK